MARKHKKGLDIAKGQTYMFPYIDMMTTLCIFFLMMYAYYIMAQSKSVVEQTAIIATKLKAEVNMNEKLKSSVKIEIIKDVVKITLPSSVVFNSGSAKVMDWAVPVLKDLSSVFQELPENYKVIVEGHTDNSPVWYGGDYGSNMELSLFRALNIMQVFTSGGNDPNRFLVSGYDEYSPIFPNDTLEHHLGNRRIEIFIRKGK